MHDIRFIRENPDRFDAAMAKRGKGPHAQTLIDLDEKRRSAITELQEAETARNTMSKQIGAAKAKGDEDEFNRLRAEVDKAKTVIQSAGEQAEHFSELLNQHLEGLPNLPAEDVPEGADEADNVEILTWGTPKSFEFTPKDHVDVGEGLGQMDFETAAHMSGARFVLLKGQLARLERALAMYMLDQQTGQNGYTEISPPFMVRSDAMYGTGQLPKFAEDSFQAGDHWLIPTSEVPLTNMAAGKILDEGQLPLRLTAHTPCFRSEAGSAGRDTRGMIRLHQFTKVEMVSITAPEQSDAEHERMTGCAEKILQDLNLPYRKVLLCTGDMGFGAQKTYDLEVWLPSQDTYREISSCSNCGDFQARRMNARYRAEGEKKPQFVHTLNGSGLAVGRTLVAVLENYQNEDGSVTVPEVLRPYMGGTEVISA